MEEGIFDSSPVKKRKRASSSRAGSTLRSRPNTRSQSLVMTASRRMSPDKDVPTAAEQKPQTGDFKGSIVLGESQFLVAPSTPPGIPETQFEVAPAADCWQEKSSQQSYEPQSSFLPQSSYFDPASQQLQQLDLPVKRSKLSRAKSMPNRSHYDQGSQSTEIMSGGITHEETFRHTVSSSPQRPSSSRRSSMYAGGQKSLMELTRQRNAEMGTSSTRRRISSISSLHSSLKPAS